MSYANGFGRPKQIIEYYIKAKGDNHFSVAKFAGGGDQPLEEYEVVMQKKPICNCMAWITGKTRPCKHAGMVQKFIDAGQPVPFVLTQE